MISSFWRNPWQRVNRPVKQADGNPPPAGPLRLAGVCAAGALVFLGAEAVAVGGRPGQPAESPLRYAPEQARYSLERILAQPEYNHPFAKFLLKAEDFLRFLQGLFQRFTDMLNGLYAESPVLYFVIMCTSLMVLLLILTHIGYVLYGSLRGGAVKGEEESRADLRRETPASLAEEAEALAARGAYVDAIRMLFRSLVSEFRRQGKARGFDTETNREFARRWCADPLRYEPIQVLVRSLDEKWYGMRPCDCEDYRLCRRMYDKLAGSPKG